MKTPAFQPIWDIAADRKGGMDKLMAMTSKPKSGAELKAIPDDRWLAMMTRCIFQAGFSWKVVDAMWPGFEEVFEGFDVPRWYMMSDDDLDRLVTDRRIVRHGTKIRSVQENASFIMDMIDEKGSAGAWFADWGPDQYIPLLLELKKKGSRLGGKTAQYFLRFMGVDSFIFSRDAVTRLIAAGIVDKDPTAKGAMMKVQGVLDDWRAETGLSLTEISQILARSTGDNYLPKGD